MGGDVCICVYMWVLGGMKERKTSLDIFICWIDRFVASGRH